MLRRQDERSFDLYLLLLKNFNGDAEGKVPFTYKEAAESLGLAERMDNVAYRRQLIRTLRKLDKRYHLVRFVPRHGKEPEIYLLNMENRDLPYTSPKKSYFRVPGSYWSLGWARRLNFRQKFGYFVCLLEQGCNRTSGFWHSSRKILSMKFGAHRGTFGQGFEELRRLNLKKRLATLYKVLPLYDPEKLEVKWEALAKKFGKDKVARAREWAAIVCRENDPQVIGEILRLLEKYGEEALKHAFDVVGKKTLDNPKRTFAYVIGILRRTSPR